MSLTSENQTKELYWDVVRLYKEGYSYRKIEALLKDSFGISYREIGYIIISYKAARKAEGDFLEAETKAREIIEEAESEAKKIIEEATREAKETEERIEENLAEKRKEMIELDEITSGARNTVESKRDEFRELRSSVDSLIGQKRLLMQSVRSKKDAEEFLEEKIRSLQYAYDTLNIKYNELENIINLLKTQKLPFLLSNILSSLSSNQIANLLISLPEDKLMKVIELTKRKKGFTPSPDPFWSNFKYLISTKL